MTEKSRQKAKYLENKKQGTTGLKFGGDSLNEGTFFLYDP